jgi:hypothetical protein
VTITVDVDTYVTVAEADAYVAARPSLSAWTDLATEVKEAALTEAAIYLDQSYSWKGSIAALTQALSWPRVNVEDREGRSITDVPAAIKKAQIELATMAASGALVQSQTTGNVESIKAGEVNIKFLKGQNVSEGERFRWIDRLLTGLYTARAGAASANIPLIRG